MTLTLNDIKMMALRLMALKVNSAKMTIYTTVIPVLMANLGKENGRPARNQ